MDNSTPIFFAALCGFLVVAKGIFLEYEIGKAAIKYKVTAITTIEGAQAAVRAIRNIKFGKLNYRSLQDIFSN